MKNIYAALVLVATFGSAWVGTAEAEDGVTHGADGKVYIFTRDNSMPALGLAWLDPSGMIWGDVVKNENGDDRQMVHSSEYMKKIGKPLPSGELGAIEYCISIKAKLPTLEDYLRLRTYMGAITSIRNEEGGYPGNGFTPQVLPHFGKDDAFWSSTTTFGTEDEEVQPHEPRYAYFLFAKGGDLTWYHRDGTFQVRCVLQK